MSRKGAQDKTSTGKRSIPRPWAGRPPLPDGDAKVFATPFVNRKFQRLEEPQEVLQGIVDTLCESGEVPEVCELPKKLEYKRSGVVVHIKERYFETLFNSDKDQFRNWCIKQVEKYLENE